MLLAEITRLVQTEFAPGVQISHATAAELLRIPLPRRMSYAVTGTVHARTAGYASPHVARGVRLHRGDEGPSTMVSGVRLTDRVTTVSDLAPLLTLDELVEAMDALLVPRRPGAAYRALGEPLRRPDLISAIAALPPGKRGIRKLRTAADLAREGVESVMETRLRLLIVRLGFVEPHVNVGVPVPSQVPAPRGAAYVPPARAERTADQHSAEASRRWVWPDLSYPSVKIGIEYDGEQFHLRDARQVARDRARQDLLHAAGWRVLSFTAPDLDDPRRIIARLEGAGCPLAPRGLARRRRELERLDLEWDQRSARG